MKTTSELSVKTQNEHSAWKTEELSRGYVGVIREEKVNVGDTMRLMYAEHILGNCWGLKLLGKPIIKKMAHNKLKLTDYKYELRVITLKKSVFWPLHYQQLKQLVCNVFSFKSGGF